MLRRLMLFIGALAIVASFFFGTLFVIDWMDTLPFPDSARADHARSIKTALEAFRASKGQYPTPAGDVPLTDLKKDLVDGKFIAAIPKDPTAGFGPNQYRYVSTGAAYGLLFHLQFPTGKIPAGGACLTGVATQGWWGNPPACPF